MTDYSNVQPKPLELGTYNIASTKLLWYKQ